MSQLSMNIPKECLEEFSRWVTLDFACRPRKFTRGARRAVNGRAVLIQSESRCYWGETRHRGTDASFCVALAVMALRLAGHSLDDACLIVGDYPSVAELDRLSSRGSRIKLDGIWEKKERIRGRYNSQMRLFGEAAMQQMLQGWLASYREDHDRSESWYLEQIEMFRNPAECGDAISIVHVARLYHELGHFDQAGQFYRQALSSAILATAEEPIRSSALS